MSSKSRTATEFAASASRYCALIDSRSSLTAIELIQSLHGVLPELLFLGSRLALPADDSSDQASGATTADKSDTLRRSLEAQLGDFDIYWMVFDPVQMDEDDPMPGTLSDDLADIYSDLHRGLALTTTAGSISASSVWEWRFGYESHWGRHALWALRHVHSLLFDHDVAGDA